MLTKTQIAIMLGTLFTLGVGVWNTAHGAEETTLEKDKDGLVHVATCNDNKEYWAKTDQHRGACALHGGVREWKDGKPVKAHGSKESHYR